MNALPAAAPQASGAEPDAPPVLRGTPLIGPVEPPFVHLMTYNLKSASGAAPNAWWKRRPLVSGLVAAERPTVLCTQEGRFRQLRELREDLDGYDWIHLGRGGGSRSESTAILWDASRLAPLDYDHLWLSRRPDRIGSRSWGSATVRMLTWVRFEDKATGKDFHVANVHLDHRSEKARRKGAAMCRDVVRRFLGPAVLAGDFNCGPDSRAHAVLAGGGLSDAWAVAERRLTPEWGTFNRWKTAPAEGPRIDWIMVRSGPPREELTVHRAGVNARTGDELTPSDHWPVQAVFTIGRE
ncbi:endonuclease/exonuclease/phosphatase family protein [Glycomyces albidus]|uniref:Endonuclease n=1 Tax=Glycomyces albidus TaxID=2656774 RepID=A0A6L5G4H8_9ACTN|nr:endonuclease/exonuclease/phosphatase family protein [Glycomyces albidus]MQM24545.1 endonuclease [Glycomyces albidus]